MQNSSKAIELRGSLHSENERPKRRRKRNHEEVFDEELYYAEYSEPSSGGDSHKINAYGGIHPINVVS